MRGQPLARLGQLTAERVGMVGGISSDGLAITGSSGPLAFLWTGQLASLGISGQNIRAGGYGITADGTRVVGIKQDTNVGFVSRAFRWDGGNVTLLPGLPGWPEDRSTAVAISGNGRVIYGSQFHRTLGRTKLMRWVNYVPEGEFRGYVLRERGPRIASFVIEPSTVVGGNGTTGTLTLDRPAGPIGSRIRVRASQDGLVFPAEFVIPANSTQGSFSIATPTVTQNQQVTFTAETDGVEEQAVLELQPLRVVSASVAPTEVAGGTPVALTVGLNGPAPTDTVVTLSSSDAAATVPASITVLRGEAEVDLTVTTQPVSTPTLARLTATLGESTAGVDLTVKPPSFVELVATPGAVTGGAGFQLRLRLSGPAPSGGLTWSLTSSSPAVVLPAALTVPSGASEATVPGSTTAVVADLTATLTATRDNVPQTANLRVLSPRLLGLVLSPNATVGGNRVRGTVSLNGDAPAGGVIVSLTSNQAAASVPASVRVPAGGRTSIFDILAAPVGARSTATITARLNGATQARPLTLEPVDYTVSISPPAAVGGTRFNGRVILTRPAPPSGVRLSLVSTSTALTVPGTVTIAPGTSVGVFTALSRAVPIDTVVQVRVSLGLRVRAASVTLFAPKLASLTLTPSTVVGGAVVTGRVALTGPAPAGGLSVSLMTNNPTLARIPSRVTIPAGVAAGSFSFRTAKPGIRTNVRIVATRGAEVAAATLTVLP